MKRYLAPLSAVFAILLLGAVVFGVFVLNGPGRTTGSITTIRQASEAQATGPLNGGFAGAVVLEASHQGVFSDTVQTTPQELGEIDLGLLLTQDGSTVTGYVDLATTLIVTGEHTIQATPIVTGEHTIQATPIAPTPLPGTPELQPVALAVGPSVSGSFDGSTLLLTSERTAGSAAGRPIARQFQMTATLETGATFLALRGVYKETLWDYSPQPLTVVGQFELIQPIFASEPLETLTPTPTATATVPGAPTDTPTATATQTPTSTPTATATVPGAPTATPTATATQTPTATPTGTPTSTSTPTATATPTGDGATVTGLVYDDKNGNGSQDGNESGIAGAEVTLTDGTRDVALTRTAITNASGVYAFADVPVGQYSLQVVLPPGQSGTVPAPSTVNVTGSDPVTVPSVAVQMQTKIYLPSVQR